MGALGAGSRPLLPLTCDISNTTGSTCDADVDRGQSWKVFWAFE